MDSTEPLLPLTLPEPGAPAPGALFSDEQEIEIRGLSTGEGLRQRDPVLYRLVVRLLGQAAPIREIKRLTGLHHRTIMAVREREGETIDTLRKSLGQRALMTAALAIERMEEQIADGSAKLGELAMAAGILVDKGQVLTGGVTSRTERIEADRVEDRLRDLLEQLPEAQVTEIPTNTGIAGGNVSAIGGVSGAGSEGSGGAGGDLESPVLQSNSARESGRESISGDLADDDGAVSDLGEGGVCSSEGGIL